MKGEYIMSQRKKPCQPRYRKHWPGLYLELSDDCKQRHNHEGCCCPVIGSGSVVYIEQRLKAGDTARTWHDVSHWGPIRILEVSTFCPACHRIVRGYIPESWVRKGKASFVEHQPHPFLSSPSLRELERTTFLRGVMFAATCKPGELAIFMQGINPADKEV